MHITLFWLGPAELLSSRTGVVGLVLKPFLTRLRVGPLVAW